jgi:hypothetical protein
MTPIQCFTTIDDVLQLAEELAARLRRLGSYKHPLAVRRGVEQMKDDQESRQLKGSGRTYFFDVAQTREGKGYLKIVRQ